MGNEDVHCRELPAGADGARFLSIYRRLSAAGLAPEVLDRTDATTIVSRKYPKLTAWLHKAHSPREIDAMGRRLYERLKEMHTHGICHRDAHDGNVVLRDGEPLFIDFNLSADGTDPERPCYDLHGPEKSGVPVPDAHRWQLDEHRYGVWWDAPIKYRTLSAHFGPLAKYRGY